MDFIIFGVVARVVAAYLLFEGLRHLHRNFTERQITPFEPDWVNWIIDATRDKSSLAVHRDTSPIRYWISIGVEAVVLLACLYVLIFGWRIVSA